MKNWELDFLIGTWLQVGILYLIHILYSDILLRDNKLSYNYKSINTLMSIVVTSKFFSMHFVFLISMNNQCMKWEKNTVSKMHCLPYKYKKTLLAKQMVQNHVQCTYYPSYDESLLCTGKMTSESHNFVLIFPKKGKRKRE